MTDPWTAVILGVVEGVTEFLPVSSTGHLIVAGTLLDYTGSKAACFKVFIQLGAILAVVALYWQRFVGLIPGPDSSSRVVPGFYGWRGVALLVLTTIPALVCGFLLHRAIKEYLFGPMTVAWALAIGGLGIILVERFKPASAVETLDGLGFGQAFKIGLFQCLAMWPGISRSAATIVGGLLCGLDRKVAAEYSFLAAVPVMIAATAYDLFKSRDFLSGTDAVFFATGFVVSFLAAALAVKTFVALVQRWSLRPFAYYRIAIAPLIYLFVA